MTAPPDLDSLRCFITAADRLSFRAASKVVGLSPAAFSERIKRLEADLGATLFERTSRRVRLTAAGHRLLPHARRTLADAAACRRAVVADGAAPAILTVGTRYELGLSWVLPAVMDLARLQPTWTLHLVFGDAAALLASLRTGEVDAVVGSMRLVEPGLMTRPLHEERYVFVAAPELADRNPLRSVEDAANHTLVDVSDALPLFRYWRDGAPAEQGWSFKEVRYLGTIATMREWVLRGLGVGVLPHYFVAEDLDKGGLVEVVPGVRATSDWFRLVWRADHPSGDVLGEIGSFLRERPLT